MIDSAVVKRNLQHEQSRLRRMSLAVDRVCKTFVLLRHFGHSINAFP